MWKFNYTTEEIERLFRINSILKGKSLKQLCENIKIAEDLGFTPEKLLRFGQILRNNPLYPKRTLKENPTIAGMDLAKAMLACPRLISVVPRNYNKIYATLKVSYGHVSKPIIITEQLPESRHKRRNHSENNERLHFIA